MKLSMKCFHSLNILNLNVRKEAALQEKIGIIFTHYSKRNGEQKFNGSNLSQKLAKCQHFNTTGEQREPCAKSRNLMLWWQELAVTCYKTSLDHMGCNQNAYRQECYNPILIFLIAIMYKRYAIHCCMP